MLPTWTYAKSPDGLFVNLFIGGRVNVGPVAGTEVEIVQNTDYPWKGRVEIAVHPASARPFALHVRVPDRTVSALYHASPEADGPAAFAVNGRPAVPVLENGYAVFRRTWKAGDTVSFEVPLPIQRVKADPRVAADVHRVALRRGPLVYNFESVDQNLEGVLRPDAELTARWEPDLLGGVVAIRGRLADGQPLTAIPNYARNNRGGRSMVWIKEEP